MDSEDSPISKPAVDRRQYRRVKLVAEVQCDALGSNEILVTRDVSLGGMFISMKFPLPVDSDVSLKFRLYPTEPAISCRARVMFSRVGLVMGIKFLDVNADVSQSLQKFVEEVA